MTRNHGSKRSASPAEAPERLIRQRDSLPQSDGCFGSKPDGAELVDDGAGPARAAGMTASKSVDAPAAEAEKDRPRMPAFLQLSEDEIHAKYVQLAELENERLGKRNDVDGEWARPDVDPVMDRYSNIHPWSKNRVILKVPEGISDYINASPVILQSTASKQSDLKHSVQDKYICMQGPKKETIDHTWHMIWHELATPYDTSPAVIIMLTPIHGLDPSGSGRTIEKCYQYFPVDESSSPLKINGTNVLGEEFKATVRFDSREEPPAGSAVEIRKLIMTLDDDEEEEKPIWHYLYPSWPDFGALEESNVKSIISVMEESRKKNEKGENARIVHCSAGVGRTGTFVALEFLMGELQGGAWEEGLDSGMDPVYDTVNQLRLQRRTMVQAFEQYAFLYEVLRKMWEEKYNAPCVGGDHEHGKKTKGNRTDRQLAPATEGGCGGSEENGEPMVLDGQTNVCGPSDDHPDGQVNVCALPGDHDHANGDVKSYTDPSRVKGGKGSNIS